MRISPSAAGKIDRVGGFGPGTAKTTEKDSHPVSTHFGSPETIESAEKPPVALSVGTWSPHPPAGTQHKDWVDRMNLWRQDPRMAPQEVVMAARYLIQRKAEHQSMSVSKEAIEVDANAWKDEYNKLWRLNDSQRTPELLAERDVAKDNYLFACIARSSLIRRAPYETQEKEYVDLLARFLVDDGHFGSAKILAGMCREIAECSHPGPDEKLEYQSEYRQKYLMMKPYVSREVLGFEPPESFQKLATSESADFDPRAFENAVGDLNTALSQHLQHLGRDLLPVLTAIADEDLNTEPWLMYEFPAPGTTRR